MKVTLFLTGKTGMAFVEEGMALYSRRLSNYCRFSTSILPAVKNAATLSPGLLKQREGEEILKAMALNDYNVLLDENGRESDSMGFASFMQARMNQGTGSIAFFIGGAWGFDERVKEEADALLSLSKMTFSHQIVRVIFLEQLYRAFSILRNEPYHNP
jgi:23S rRNA (pseudouridine1915-N3)-methyltransferase